jgi:hypothetical protein
MKRDFVYESNNIVYDEQYPEGGIKCKNFEICECVLPECWFEYKGKYLCIHCDCMFGSWTSNNYSRTGKGELIIKDNTDNTECPICFEIIEKTIDQPNCDHTLCIECFKKWYYAEDKINTCPLCRQ